ncbi:AAA family ATPase [Parabacteroides sp. PF5-6]|uniref:AAA family ATPase n=1 Tax=Parabacteroides sp. PF5-6 TaxID=1742403 RepID=UPI0024068622|nr:AAA family ATPase [Parabacteroides sp. PF5-6]MDF9830625.1 putative ATPase [Parabacteroides sp. PF5-6]
MITKIEIDGFKSFYNYSMEFTPLTVIAGTNASGKSNLFDALKLLSRLADTDLRTAFSDKSLRGDVSELFMQYSDNKSVRQMTFAVEMLVNRLVTDNWGGEATVKTPRLRYELSIMRRENGRGFDELVVTHEQLSKINTEDDVWARTFFKKKNEKVWKSTASGGSGKPYIYTEIINEIPTIKIRQDGRQGGKATAANSINQTVLGNVTTVDFPHVLAVKKEMLSWNFMQLNPEILREPTRQDAHFNDVIGHAGENVAAALYRIKQEDPYQMVLISRKLASFLPDFTQVDVVDDAANKQFVIKLRNMNGKEFSSRVLSEGTLRILTLCILLFDNKHDGLLCFEEPENGIHPFRMKSMVDLLRELAIDLHELEEPLRQVIVNTHSPVLLKHFYRNPNDSMSIWLSKLTSAIVTLDGERCRLRISKMIALTSDLRLPFSDAERKTTMIDAERYLESGDGEYDQFL